MPKTQGYQLITRAHGAQGRIKPRKGVKTTRINRKWRSIWEAPRSKKIADKKRGTIVRNLQKRANPSSRKAIASNYRVVPWTKGLKFRRL